MKQEELKRRVVKALGKLGWDNAELARRMGTTEMHVYRILSSGLSDQRELKPHHLYEIIETIHGKRYDPDGVLLKMIETKPTKPKR